MSYTDALNGDKIVRGSSPSWNPFLTLLHLCHGPHLPPSSLPALHFIQLPFQAPQYPYKPNVLRPTKIVCGECCGPAGQSQRQIEVIMPDARQNSPKPLMTAIYLTHRSDASPALSGPRNLLCISPSHLSLLTHAFCFCQTAEYLEDCLKWIHPE